VRSWMRLGPTDALSWRCQASPHAPGRLALEVLDPEGSLRAPGEPSSAAAAVRPLASVRLRRGYRTAAGEEIVDTGDWFVLSAVRTEGLGGGRLQVEAMDALGLLALWHPPESLVWLDRTILWLLEEICARVGLVVDREGAPGLDTVMPAFALHPHHTALTAVHSLLRLGQAVARPRPEGRLQVLDLPDGSGVLPEIGGNGEIREGACGVGAVEATLVRVSSPACAVYAEDQSLLLSQAMGGRLPLVIEDNRIDTAGLAAAVAVHALALAALGGRADRATVPLRPDLELWDAVTLVAQAGALPASDTGARVITELSEDVCPARNRFETRVSLGAVG